MARTPHRSVQTRALLQTLLESPRTWRHGYELSAATGLKSGTLYPLLMRLSDHGLLESKWEEADRLGRPPRHLYRLSPKGAALAREHAAEDRPAPSLAARGATA